MITICFTYFKSLTLANLAAALYSVRRQDLSRVAELVVVDNDTADTVVAIQAVIDALAFPIPVRVQSYKHDDVTRAQSWSTNVTVREAQTPWVFYTRADYLLAFGMLQTFVSIIDSKPDGWNGFITSNGCHLANAIEDCDATRWREEGPRLFRGVEYDYTSIDSGVWMARRDAFEAVGGFDERLSAWGHAQTHFQYKLYQAGVEFVRIPEVMFWHPLHGAARDIDVAHRQLAAYVGIDIRDMWARYEGPKFY